MRREVADLLRGTFVPIEGHFGDIVSIGMCQFFGLLGGCRAITIWVLVPSHSSLVGRYELPQWRKSSGVFLCVTHAMIARLSDCCCFLCAVLCLHFSVESFQVRQEIPISVFGKRFPAFEVKLIISLHPEMRCNRGSEPDWPVMLY